MLTSKNWAFKTWQIPWRLPVDFKLVLSEEGQSLLLNPDIARIPISPEVQAKYGQTPKEVKDLKSGMDFI